MRFLCLPGQTLAGRPTGLLTPRHTAPLPGWQGKGALRALSVQYGPPQAGISHTMGCRQAEGRAGPQGECCPASGGDSGGDVLARASPSPTAYLGLDEVFPVNLWVYLRSWPYQFELRICCDRSRSQARGYGSEIAEGTVGDATLLVTLMVQIWRQGKG